MLPPFPAPSPSRTLPLGTQNPPFPKYLLKRGPVFQMLVLPTQPRGGSVMFSFSNRSCTAWATTATASLMWADSFFPLMSCKPMTPATSRGAGQPHWAPLSLLQAGLAVGEHTVMGLRSPRMQWGGCLSSRQAQVAAAVLGWHPTAYHSRTGGNKDTEPFSQVTFILQGPSQLDVGQGSVAEALRLLPPHAGKAEHCVGPTTHSGPPRHRVSPLIPSSGPLIPAPSRLLQQAWPTWGRCLRQVPTIRGVAQGIARDLPFPHQPHVAGARHIEHGC